MSETRPKTYVYIAGPYGDRDPYCTIDERINNARRAARSLAIEGIPYYSPHLNCAHFEAIAPEATVDFWRTMGLVFLQSAWGLWLLDGWKDSAGCLIEFDTAARIGVELWGPAHTAAEIASAWRQ